MKLRGHIKNLILIFMQILKQPRILIKLNNNIQISHTKMKIINLFALCLLASAVCAADQGDWVDVFNLPIGFHVQPFYAGFLSVPGQKSYFYVYHPSESNPSKDPLVVRLSLGPGCSPMYDWLYSKGPFVFDAYNTTFHYNKHNWNKEANVLFIEGPAGVGFSYDKSANASKTINDIEFAFQNLRALFSFYEKFPELKDQAVYLSGEQYAGMTIPLLSEMIIQHNRDPYVPIWSRINLKGFLLENPCTLRDECDSHFEFPSYTIEYLRNHYFITTQKFEEYQSKCRLTSDSPECLEVVHQIENSFVKTNSDITNPYKKCVLQTGPEKYKCMDTIGILAFMNDKLVREDLNVLEVEPDLVWDLCNLDITEKFVRDHDGALKIYEKLLREEHDLRIWIISGTLSAAVPITGTRKWVEQLKENLGVPTIRPWESWKYDTDINAGEIQEIRGLTLATVRSAGMKIYQDQPEIGYYIFDSFVKGKRL